MRPLTGVTRAAMATGVILALLLAGWAGSMGGPARPLAATDVQDVVFHADDGPVLIRLHVRADGQPLAKAHRDSWTVYIRHLFEHLDGDGDGFLTEVEARRLPAARPMVAPASGSSIAVNVAFNFRVVDANGDGKISMDELLDYYRQYSGPALQTRYAPSSLAISQQLGEVLFALLDTNKDGKLSQEELAAAGDLMKLDTNADELLSPQELAPKLLLDVNPGAVSFTTPVRRGSLMESSAFMVLSQDDPPSRLAMRLREKYGETRFDVAAVKTFAEGPADLELIFRLGQLGDGEKSVEVLRHSKKASVVKDTAEGLLITFGKTRVEFRCNQGQPVITPDLRQRYLQQFRSADIVGKGFLGQRDAEVRGFYPAQFGLLDRDSDGKLTEKELLAYLDEVQERQARALASTAALLISQEGRTLFDILDRNRDGRLSHKELRLAPELLLGRKPGETLAAADLPRTYVVAIGLGGASFDRFGGLGTFSLSGMPLLELDWTPPGLAWFFKMDRNHDGEVTWREFLGTRDDYRRLDTNGDGVISIEEALRARK